MFYQFYLEIHKEDIQFMELVLECVEKNDDEEVLVNAIERRKSRLPHDNLRLDGIYRCSGLRYNALENIFL